MGRMPQAQNTTKRHDIIGGPSATAVWDAAKYRFDPRIRFVTTFTLHNDVEINLSITGANHMDSSGHKLEVIGTTPDGNRFRMQYDAKRRRGVLIETIR